MAVDKVKPLKIENPSTGGTETDMFPTEMNPTADYAAVKGLAFENDDNFRLEKIFRAITSAVGTYSVKPTYLANGEVDTIEFYNSSSQITANRIAKVTFTYDGSLNPTQELLQIYQTDGTTVARTYTSTNTFVNADLTKIDVVET